MAQQVFKSPAELSNNLRDKDDVLTPLSDDDYKYFNDAGVKVSKDLIGGSDYLDTNGYFIHNDRMHGDAESSVRQKYEQSNPKILQKIYNWIYNNSIVLSNGRNLNMGAAYIQLPKEPNEIQYNQIAKWLDKYLNNIYSNFEVNFTKNFNGGYLGHKQYHPHETTSDEILKDIKRFYASRKEL